MGSGAGTQLSCHGTSIRTRLCRARPQGQCWRRVHGSGCHCVRALCRSRWAEPSGDCNKIPGPRLSPRPAEAETWGGTRRLKSFPSASGPKAAWRTTGLKKAVLTCRVEKEGRRSHLARLCCLRRQTENRGSAYYASRCSCVVCVVRGCGCVDIDNGARVPVVGGRLRPHGSPHFLATHSPASLKLEFCLCLRFSSSPAGVWTQAFPSLFFSLQAC